MLHTKKCDGHLNIMCLQHDMLHTLRTGEHNM